MLVLDKLQPYLTKNTILRSIGNCIGSVVAFSAVLCTLGYAQSASAPSDGSAVPAPIATGDASRVDPAALETINQYRVAIGPTPWRGMQGTGQIIYGKDAKAYSATLSILGATEFRLDGQAEMGQISLRIDGRRGQIQEGDGRRFPIPPDTAASGIFQCARPRMADFPSPQETLIDRGVLLVDGVWLHRVTMEFSDSDHRAADAKSHTIATDLYFDPASHLLMKSVNAIRIDGAGNNRFLRVITYGDYRKVGDAMIPFRYTQTLDGQEQWTLQLTDVQLNPSIDTSFFQF